MKRSVVLVVGASDDAVIKLESETRATVLRFAHALAAVAEAQATTPNVIVMGPEVWTEERSMLIDLAARSGARLVRLAA